MSKCSKKCNDIKKKIDSISGLDDDTVYEYLKCLEKLTNEIVRIIKEYADEDELNGTIFKKFQ